MNLNENPAIPYAISRIVMLLKCTPINWAKVIDGLTNPGYVKEDDPRTKYYLFPYTITENK
jgi:hypothetical protein